MQRMSCHLLLMDLSWIYIICAVMNFQFDIFLSFCLSRTMHLKVTIRIKFQGKVFRGQEIDFNNIFLYQFYNYYLSQKKKKKIPQLLLWNRDLIVVTVSTVVIAMIIYTYRLSLSLKIWNLLSFIMLLPVTCIYTLEICTCTYQHFKI